MIGLLKLLDDRLAEPSTWASIASMLVLLHVNLDPGVWKAMTMWGTGFAAVLGFILAEEAAGKSPRQFATDVLNAITNKQGPKQ